MHECGRFVSAIDEIIDMDSEEFAWRSEKAIALAKEVATNEAVIEANYALFNRALMVS